MTTATGHRKPNAMTYHLHAGMRVSCNTAYAQFRRGRGGMRTAKLRTFFPVCGFHPGDLTLSLMLQVMDRINGVGSGD